MPVFILKLLSNRKTATNLFNTAKRYISIKPNNNFCNITQCNLNNKFKFYSTNGVQTSLSMLQMKKRPIRKKKPYEDDEKIPGSYTVMAYSSADEYDLEKVIKGLREQDLYEPKYVENNRNALHAVAKYRVDAEPREIFFFREGSVVLWNTTELESSNVLNFLKPYEHDNYAEHIVQNESEYMNYKHQANK